MIKIEEFLLTQGWSKSTIEKYRRALYLFKNDFPIASTLTATSFSNWLNKPNWGSSNKWVYYTAIRQYISWAYGSSHPALIFKFKRKDSPPQRVLSLDQVKILFQIFNTSTPKGKRDLAICSLFLDSGLRVSEVCSLELSRMHLSDFYCDVFIKGGRWERALFSEYTSSCIDNWLSIRSSFASPSCRSLFCSLGGNSSGSQLTREGLQRIVFYWGKEIGLKLSPHDLRRTFATLATIAGAPSRLLQAAGRWSDISMVERYTRSIQVEGFRPYFPVNFVMRD